jgi:hypothetical protein
MLSRDLGRKRSTLIAAAFLKPRPTTSPPPNRHSRAADAQTGMTGATRNPRRQAGYEHVLRASEADRRRAPQYRIREAGPRRRSPRPPASRLAVRHLQFCDVAPLLASAGYRVIVPYMRGYGSTRFLCKQHRTKWPTIG